MNVPLIRGLFLASCFLLFCVIANAQSPVAAFTSNVTTGCAPLTVSFRDQSTGNPVFWSWNFGDLSLSSAQNPTFTFSTPGTYKVSLVVRNANGTNGIEKDNYITVLPSPSSNFSADFITACQPANINFRDASTSTVGTINSWEWVFGDGNRSTDRNPSHTYADNGFYTVSLKVTSSSGCSATNTKGRYIRVVSGVDPNFTTTVSSACVAPFEATFTNETSGPGNLTYLWRFHDGTTSTDPAPVRSYPTAGNYDVKLIASSDLGCKDSVTVPVAVNGANVGFTPPTGACIDRPLSFVNTSTSGATDLLWDFGDGSQSTAINPTKTYTAAGTYTVTLTSNYGFCSGTATQTVVVTTVPSVDFTANQTNACRAPFVVAFSAAAPDAAQWLWNFGDGNTSTEQNPSHQYNSTGNFNVTLTITNANGCTNTITKPAFIKIQPPAISLGSVAEGCVNSSNYRPIANNHIAINSPDPIATYTWNWGDGSTGTGINASHVYTGEGQYTVTLTVRSTGGCDVTSSFPNAVLIGSPAVVDFTADKLLICDKEDVIFTNTSNPTGDQWRWEFEDGSTSTDANPTHMFTGVDLHTVSLTVRNGGCYTTTTKTDYIQARAPVARFEYNIESCTDPFTYTFVSTSDTSTTPQSTYLWDFGTGTETMRDVTFTFTDGFRNYPVSLEVRDLITGCVSSFTQMVNVFTENVVLSANDITPCKNQPVTLNASVGEPQNISSYEWRIEGTSITGKPASWDTSFANAGTYNISAVLTDINGCTFSSATPLVISVTGPTAQFAIPVNKVCKDATLSLIDQSIAPPAGIKSIEWNWGDGTTATGSNPSHQYTDSGSFTVKLTVTDNNNCVDALEYIDTIKIRRPVAGFTTSNTLFCRGGDLLFTDTSFGHIDSYEWTFGDGKMSADRNPIQVYEGDDGKYTITLKVIDDAGCEDQVTKTDYIEIRSPKPAFTVSDSISLCRVFETKFTFAGTDYQSYYWDFGDEATSSLQNPTHFYNEFGDYTAKLYLVGFGGCLDSAEHSIQLIRATSNMIRYTIPAFACNELSVDFTLIPPPSVAYAFNFGDGQSDNSGNKFLTHLYAAPQTYYPVLQLKDNQGCEAQAGGNPPVVIKGALPFYSQDRNKFCDEGEVIFTSFMQSNDPIVRYEWNFGDRTTSSTDLSIIHRFTTPGVYITSLTAETDLGCIKTFEDTVRVYRTPVPSIAGDDIVCINNPISFQGVLAVADSLTNWKWTLGNNTTSTDATVNTQYTTAGNYTLNLEASNLLGCSGTITKAIEVKPLPEINGSSNLTTPVRAPLLIPLTYSDNIETYNWTPANDLSCTNCPNPVANPQFTTAYNVAVVDQFGCEANKDITITVICNETNYFIPNTFSPNGDGNNDVFYPRGKGIYNVVSMRIFNRWGEMVFEKRNFRDNDPAAGWNGFYKGKRANPDVYMYIVEVVCDNAQVIPLKGNVTLLR